MIHSFINFDLNQNFNQNNQRIFFKNFLNIFKNVTMCNAKKIQKPAKSPLLSIFYPQTNTTFQQSYK